MKLSQAKRIVIKIGTSSLTHPNGKPNLRRFEKLARVLCDLKNAGKEIVLVSSGAISVGCNRLGLEQRPQDTRGKQAAAAVGQCDLMSIYDRLFGEYGQVSAQILLTRDVIDDEHRKENVINTFSELLKLGVIPIVNENDTVSVEEIEFGDNDKLSAIVAVITGADALIILTDIDGLYDRDPKLPGAKKIAEVHEINEALLSIAGGSGSNRGTGGMHSKLEAAKLSMDHSITTVIASCADLENLYRILDDEPIGTQFSKEV